MSNKTARTLPAFANRPGRQKTAAVFQHFRTTPPPQAPRISVRRAAPLTSAVRFRAGAKDSGPRRLRQSGAT